MTKDLPLGDDAVVAVVVTRHRRELLADSLKVIAAQTRPPDHVIVVDNGPDQPARDVVAACPVPTSTSINCRTCPTNLFSLLFWSMADGSNGGVQGWDEFVLPSF